MNDVGVEDGRIDAPLLSLEQWNNALLRNGFNGVMMSAYDYEGPAQRSAMIVSKAVIHEASQPRFPAKLLLSPSWETQVPAFVTQLSAVLNGSGLNVSTALFPVKDISAETLYIILDDGTNPILTIKSPTLFNSITALLVESTRIIWINSQQAATDSTNSERGLITGFARVARAENESLKLITLDVHDSMEGDYNAILQAIKDIIETGFYELSSNEFDYVFKGGKLYIPRLLVNDKVNRRIKQVTGLWELELQPFHQPNRPLRVKIEKPGFLDSLQFVDDETMKKPLSDLEIEVKVEACGVNFKHVFIASGQMRKPDSLSGEYAGTVTKVGARLDDEFRIGDRVCGMGEAYASNVRVDGRTACRLPESMSLVLGASIPIVFSTAYYAMVDVARLQKGQTILIHSAAGGVGQAALRIAQHIGAEIFATVGSATKRNLLVDKFGIPEDHIFSSKMRTFKKGIYRLTNGRGVDVVLNSISGQTLQDSWACIASLGTFLELGKTDANSKSLLRMDPFDRNVTFASIDLEVIYNLRPERTGEILAKILSLFEAGHYLPISPITTMPITEIEDAFRLMQARKHMGKIVLEAKSEAMVLAIPKAEDTLVVPENGTYLIAGGLGGIGLEIARFMAAHGAKHIVLLSRRTLESSKQKQLQDEFRLIGVEIRVFSCDITDIHWLQEIISSCVNDMPPVKGLIQTAMVLRVCQPYFSWRPTLTYYRIAYWRTYILKTFKQLCDQRLTGL
jgi:NADPH:quinone reductase-like Zn-dependent oxidoreductase